MYKIYTIVVLPITILLIGSPLRGGYTGVPQNRDNAIEEESLGLYNSSDKVISLTVENMKLFIMNQKYGTLLEFYNSFCGHCRRFAPKYKQLADDIYSWRKLIKIAAIDCADDQNNDICREYEIMSYPSLRYFPPYYIKGDDQAKIGITIKSQELDDIKKFLINHAINESISDGYWKDFTDLSDTNIGNIFLNVSEKVKYILVIYENENSTLASSLILDMSLIDKIHIRRTTNPDVAVAFNIITPTTIALIDRNGKLEKIHSINSEEISFKNAIDKFLTEKNIHRINLTTEKIFTQPIGMTSSNKSAIIEYVKDRGLHVVYKMDLDHALYYTIFHEIPKYISINGERLLALQRFINIISRYNPLGKNGEEFMRELKDYIMANNQNIDGIELENFAKELKNKNNVPLFSTTDLWVGCVGSKSTLRGFTCGLWKLFHYLTVQAAEESDQTTDSLDVLQAIHDYVKHFFGCTECSQHFQEMAKRRKIWNVVTKDEAILWLWLAHNEVNKRLAGDETEDPQFPKQQFPSFDICNQCYNKNTLTSPNLDEINWNKQEVLQFVKHIYNQKNISFYGTNSERIENSKKLAQIMGNVFSDIDISVGFVLYGFCILMMIFAVKLFMFQGYRRKPYQNNMSGKV